MKNVMSSLVTASILGLASNVGANTNYEPSQVRLTAGSPELVALCKITANNANSIILNREEVCDPPSSGNNKVGKDSVIEYSKDDGKTWIIYLGGASLAGLASTILWRIRKKKKNTTTESTTTESKDDEFLESDTINGGILYTEGKKELSGAEDDEDNMQKTDYDKETDLYMSYGLYTQAEKMLEKALETSGKDIIINIKLLEIYHKLMDKNKFEILFKKNQKQFSFSNGTELVSKIKTWGRNLDANNSLYK